MNLRPYQKEAIEAISAAFRKGQRRPLVVMATGAGKTILFAEAAKRTTGRVLVLAHRRELVKQAHEKLSKWTDEPIAVEMSGKRQLTKPEWEDPRIAVASIQSVSGRLDSIPRDHFMLIIIDEAHHATAATYKKVVKHFRSAFVLGVTATADRADGTGLGKVFSSCVYEYSLKDGIRDGHLVPPKSFFVRTSIDLKGVKKRAGDFATNELEEIVNQGPSLAEIADPVIEHSVGRPAIVFCVSIAHTQAMARVLCERSGDENFARAIDGKTSQENRDQAIADLKAGEIRALVNCGVFLEGWDCAEVALVAMARPTLSRSLYAQAIGRGTRPSPGKDDCLVLDFVPSNARHRLISTVDLTGSEVSNDVLDAAYRIAERLVATRDVVPSEEVMELARQEVEAKKAAVKYKLMRTDPFAAAGINEEIIRQNSRGKTLATQKQVGFLVLKGVPFEKAKRMKKSVASALIEEIIERQKKGLCTPNQALTLAKHGFDGRELPFAIANAVLDALAESDWHPNEAFRPIWELKGVPLLPQTGSDVPRRRLTPAEVARRDLRLAMDRFV